MTIEYFCPKCGSTEVVCEEIPQPNRTRKPMNEMLPPGTVVFQSAPAVRIKRYRARCTRCEFMLPLLGDS